MVRSRPRPALVALSLGAMVLAGCSTPAPGPVPLALGAPTAERTIAVIAIAPCPTAGDCEAPEPDRAYAGFTLPEVERTGLLFEPIARGAHASTAAIIDSTDNADVIRDAWLKPVQAMVRDKGWRLADGARPLYLAGELAPAGKASFLALDMSDRTRISGVPELGTPVLAHDLVVLGREEGADYVLVLEVLRHGVSRHIGSFGIPSTVPYAIAVTRAYAIDVADGSLVYNDYAHRLAATDVTDSEDKERERDALVQATRGTLREAIEESRERLVSGFDATP